jgi:hypothetical protein
MPYLCLLCHGAGRVVSHGVLTTLTGWQSRKPRATGTVGARSFNKLVRLSTRPLTGLPGDD